MFNFAENGYNDVWADNLPLALKHIREIAVNYPVVAIDTEFPGNPHGSDKDWDKPGRMQEAYNIVKKNVDATNIISLGCLS